MKIWFPLSKSNSLACLLLAVIALALPAQARAESCEALRSRIAAPLSQARTGTDESGLKLYHFGMCFRNIWLLAQNLEKQGFPLEGAEVLYIDRQDQKDFYPLLPRDPPKWMGTTEGKRAPFQWGGYFSFHVVLEYQGLILDLDFTNDVTILPAAEYFARMFGPEASGFQVHRVPALDYAREMQIQYPRFLRMPAEPLERYLDSIREKRLCE